MTAFASYDDTGRILFKGDVPGSMLHLQPGNIYAGEVDIASDYIVDRQPMRRPSFPAKLTGTTLSDLPEPCTLTINGQPFEVTSETVELAFPHPGSYLIRVVKWPYLDGVFEVNV